MFQAHRPFYPHWGGTQALALEVTASSSKAVAFKRADSTFLLWLSLLLTPRLVKLIALKWLDFVFSLILPLRT